MDFETRDGIRRPERLATLLPTAHALANPIIKLERSSRALAATLVYEGLIQRVDPLVLFDDEQHVSFWFGGGAKQLAVELASAAEERVYELDAPVKGSQQPESASPLLAARARRAQKTKRLLPADLRRPAPVPAGAVPEGPETSADDVRASASRGLVRAKLAALQPRRAALEQAVDEMLDPLAAPKLPAFDLAIVLLFLSELEGDGLPVPVACNEAVALSVAYSGDEQGSHRHVNGLLASYARERLGREK